MPRVYINRAIDKVRKDTLNNRINIAGNWQNRTGLVGKNDNTEDDSKIFDHYAAISVIAEPDGSPTDAKNLSKQLRDEGGKLDDRYGKNKSKSSVRKANIG